MSSHSLKSIINALKSAGIDADTILCVLSELDESKDASRREKTRDRVRRHREKVKSETNVTDEDAVTHVTHVTHVTVTDTLSPPCSPPFSPTPPNPPPIIPPKPKKPANDLRNAFEAVWADWPSVGKKRSKSKAKVFEAYRIAATKTETPEALNAAIRRWIGDPQNSADQFAPALERYLRDGKWEHYLSQAETLVQRTPEEDLERRLRLWRQNPGSTWPERWGPEPEEVSQYRNKQYA